MPIINRGHYSLDTIFDRQVGNDWPTAQVISTADVIEASTNLYYTNDRVISAVTPLLTTANVLEDTNLYYTNARVAAYIDDNVTTSNIAEGDNLYYTNARVASNIISLMQSFEGDGIEIEANGRISANVQAAQTVASINNFTTDDLNEGSANLYFTLARAREAYTAGLGIAISEVGVISAKGDDTGTGMFNSGINLSIGQLVSNVYANLATFSAVDGDSFIVYSLHATNITGNTVYLNGRYVIENKNAANTVLFANLFEIPGNTSLELLRKPQVFKPDDQIQLLSYSDPRQPANNLISVYMSYQASEDTAYKRVAKTITNNQLTEVFTTPAQTSIIESLVLNNLGPNVIPVTTFITDGSDNVVSYLTSNLSVPARTSVEICEYPKAIPENYKIKVNKFGAVNDQLSVSITSKFTTYYAIASSANTISEGDSVTFNIETLNIGNGTLLYYTLEEVSGNITQDDFVTPISGEVTIQNDAAVLTLQSNDDASSFNEGPDIFRLQLRKGSTLGTIVTTGSNVTILDTSNTRTLFVSTSGLVAANTSGEGDVLTFNINTTNYPDGTILYYSTKGNVTSSNFVESNVGYVTIVNNANSFSLTSTNIPTNQTRLMDVEIRETDSNGSLLRNTGSIYVYDSAMLYSTATGGTNVYVMTDSETGANYSVHSFTTSGTFTVTKVGQVFPEFEYLMTAGGGGSSSRYNGSGGGGGGGLITGNIALSVSPYTINVGGGGTGYSGDAPAYVSPYAQYKSNGGNTEALGFVAVGGGAGGIYSHPSEVPAGYGNNGGSGGGSSFWSGSGVVGGTAYPGQGYPGGSINGTPQGTGGGGAGGAGGPAGYGGAGYLSNISGIAKYYAAGGYGGYAWDPPVTNEGQTLNDTSGAPGTGAGGGASRIYFIGGSGGGGIVIVRYRTQ